MRFAKELTNKNQVLIKCPQNHCNHMYRWRKDYCQYIPGFHWKKNSTPENIGKKIRWHEPWPRPDSKTYKRDILYNYRKLVMAHYNNIIEHGSLNEINDHKTYPRCITIKQSSYDKLTGKNILCQSGSHSE